MIRVNTKDFLKFIIVAVSGLAAGFISGLLGAGGGIVLIFVLNAVFGEDGKASRDNFATSLAAVTVYSLVSAAMYNGNGQLPVKEAGIYFVPAAVGGIAGAYLLDKINTLRLKQIFAAVVIYAGISMLR